MKPETTEQICKTILDNLDDNAPVLFMGPGGNGEVKAEIHGNTVKFMQMVAGVAAADPEACWVIFNAIVTGMRSIGKDPVMAFVESELGNMLGSDCDCESCQEERLIAQAMNSNNKGEA